MATANDPSAALTWLSRVLAFMRANRAPISAPMPTSATPRTHGGRPPSTSPAPCSTLDPSIAPNIQLAGNLTSRSSSAAATEAATSSISSSGAGDLDRHGRRRRRSHPGQRQQQRQRRGENDHPHGLHHGDGRHVGALLGGEDGDLRQRARDFPPETPRSGPSRGRAADKGCCRMSSRRWRAPATRWSTDRR